MKWRYGEACNRASLIFIMEAIFDPRLPITLGGKERYFYCSFYTIGKIQDKYGSLDELNELLETKKGLETLYWLAKLLLDEGEVYTRFMETGETTGAKEISEREINLLINPSNVNEVKEKLFAAFTIGSKGTLEPLADDTDDKMDEADIKAEGKIMDDEEALEYDEIKNAEAGKKK